MYNFKTLFNFDVSKDNESVERIPKEADFATVIPGEKQVNKVSTRGLWYADNNSFFVATNDGWLVHYDIKG